MLQGKADTVIIPQGMAGLQPIKGDPLPDHDLLHIHPRAESPLHQKGWLPIYRLIKDLQTQMGHADLIDVRKAEKEAAGHLFPIFFYFIIFTAQITLGLGYRLQKRRHGINR